MIKVSIVVPVYNVEKYLKESLDSAVNQSLKDIEIIVVNDGSTDNSQEILKVYEEKYSNLKVINQENKGLSGARNTGIAECKGEYIYFLDSDDYIDLNSMEYCYNEAKKDSLDILTFDAETFLDGKLSVDEINKEEFYRENLIESKTMSGEEFYVYSNQKGAYRAPVWLNFYKREFIEKNNLIFYEGIVHEDEIHTSKSFILAKKIKYIPKRFFFRRVRENSIMTREIDESRIKGNYIIAKEAYKLFKYEVISEKAKNILVIWISKYYSNCIKYCDSLGLKDKRDFIINNIEEDVLDTALQFQIENPELFYSKCNIKRNLFLVKTGYHLLLATSVAIDTYIGCMNDLFIFDRDNIKFSLDGVSKVFDNIYDLGKLPQDLYDNIFTHNESDATTQLMCNMLFKDTENVIYIEDGSASYCDSVITYNEEFEKLNHIECIKVLGTYSKIKQRIFLYPDLVRNELNDGKLSTEINLEYLKKAIDLVYGNYEFNINKKTIFIALEHRDSFNLYNLDLNKYKEIIAHVIENFKEYNILIKYHPRDDSKYMDEYLSKYMNVNWVDKYINIEVFYKYDDILIISSTSTSILSMNKLRANVCVISKILSNNEHRLLDVFSNLNVFIPDNVQQLYDYINDSVKNKK
ncbi:glycosyltransferase [Paraclostridium sordellii]|uniref:Capsular polysaccharide biosynthsis protein n=1 Tax=Paraclostridium sordellii TaxID=1505 RepID=A0A0C7GBN2_PARSO|nr:glycosyltransferase [Paeniclostridium sordellii]CEN79301.1 capsular polysaccharide biosynthsis protein [[Clostridium] sordellii] [Paeniclostridium sordellii]CEQ04451.1 capsular polysaccharide biosynthsis protein [[Clostridium] sordellii] [Paeniclostridium sordellii]